MFPYLILLLYVLFLSFFHEKLYNFKKVQFIFKVLLFSVLVLFAGLRSFSVGTDTNSYLESFFFNSGKLLDVTNYTTTVEIGYKLLETLIKSFTNDKTVFLCCVASVFVFLQLRSIYKISRTPMISLFIIITWGIYLFSFNGLRQGIAASIYLLALPFVIKGNFKKYLLLVLVAFLFHKTIILTLPLYFIFRLRFSFKFFVIILIASLVLFLYSKQLIESGTLISDKYSVYSKMKATGGRNFTLLYLMLSVFFMFFRRFVKRKYLLEYDVFLKMLIIGTLVFLMVTFTNSYVEITRIAIYFTSSILFIWPIVFKSLINKAKPLVFVLFVLINFAFFYTFINKIGDLVPYNFYN